MSLSIIIPHYNNTDLLEKLLVSIPQANKEIQTIVVDDKSDLFYLKKIKDLKTKFDFELYHNNKNKSAGMCRNIGFEKAKNIWVTFADGDDYFVKDFYDKAKIFFNIDLDVIFFAPTSQYLDTGKIADRHESFLGIIQNYLNHKNKKNEFMLRYNFISTWSKIMRKEFMIKHNIKFDEGPMGAEDVMLSTKIGHFMKKFHVTKDVIYCRIVRYGSVTRIFNENQFDIRLHARVSRIKFLNANLKKNEIELIMKPLIYNKAAEFLILSLRRFGFKKFKEVYNLYQRENIKWFRIIYLNPIKLFKYLLNVIHNYIKNNRYNVK
jgi:glycosyltransferase involved in cell wall biosynthesis